MMLGYLLARAGVHVTVLEKHKDFFRDFRGDTVHPSTLELMYELGLLEDFLKVPHQQLTSAGTVSRRFSTSRPPIFAMFPCTASLSRSCRSGTSWISLPAARKTFLPSAADGARGHRSFARDGARITGVEAKTPEGTSWIHADLVVGCDGRHSVVRKAADLSVREFGVPIDVLWFRISRHRNDPEQLLGNINFGKVLILIDRSDYFQAGLIVRKGSFEQIQSEGLVAFRQTLLKIAPFLGDRVSELESWDQVRLLSVQINRLPRWYRHGLLCIGDSAHAMSPAGGVGINLAIQDAVAAANRLSAPLREKRVTEGTLRRIQNRRKFPTRATQALQINAHKLFEQVFENPGGNSALATGR